MESPRKSGFTESKSPLLAKYIEGSVRRRESLNTKKSSGTGKASGSTQSKSRKWSPRKGREHQPEPFEADVTLEVAVSPKSSESSSNLLRQRNRSVEGVAEVSSLGSTLSLHLDEEPHSENIALSANQNEETVPARNKLTGKLGGIFPSTPTSGYHNLSENLSGSSPRAGSSLSSIRNPSPSHNFTTMSKDTNLFNQSQSASLSSQRNLNLPDLERKREQRDSSFLGTPLSDKQDMMDAETDKRAEKLINQKPRTQFDLLSFDKKRQMITGKSKRHFEKTIPGEVEEPSSPLLGCSLSNQIKASRFAFDPSGSMVLKKESDVSLRWDERQSQFEQCDSMEVVRVHQGENEHMSSSIRSTSERDGFMQIMKRCRSVSELHGLCACMTTIDDVRLARSLFVGGSQEEVLRRDYKGETLMHAFSNNKMLAVRLTRKTDFETKDFFVLYQQPTFDQKTRHQLQELTSKLLLEYLLPSFPEAMMVEDKKGYIPFEEGLLDWVATIQKPNDLFATDNAYYSMQLSSYTNAVSDAVSSAWKSTSTTFMTAMSKMTDNNNSVGKGHDLEKGGTGGLHQVSSQDELEGEKGDTPRISNKMKLSPHARFCLQMLSLVIDQLERTVDVSTPWAHSTSYARGCVGADELQRMYGLDLVSQVVDRIASIPNLLQTILCISEDMDAEYALSTTVIRRVLVNKNSVGRWLTTMLQSSHRNVSRRAIDYLQTVSKLCCEEEKSNNRNKGPRESAFEDVIDEVSRLRDFVPSLLSLGENGIEEVSTTKVGNDVLDKMISRPFVATVVLCDAIFLTLMIMGFRFAVNGMIMGGTLETVLSWIYVVRTLKPCVLTVRPTSTTHVCFQANTGIFYFLIQEIGKVVSLLLLSSHSRKYFVSFWNLIDVLAIILALVSSIAIRWQFAIHKQGLEDASTLRGLLAITTGFLWLRVLSFLKSINIQLATFILAIISTYERQ
jgi:hypothetical protein